jgi:hypothetical protein
VSDWLPRTRDWSPILKLDRYDEIVPIDIERNVDILGMQIRSGGITKSPDFATGQDQSANGVWITRPAFKPVAEVDGAEFVFLGSLLAVRPSELGKSDRVRPTKGHARLPLP